MDREAWRAAIHGVTKSWTWLSDWTELNWTDMVKKDFTGEIILGFPDASNGITRIPVTERGRQESQSQRKCDDDSRWIREKQIEDHLITCYLYHCSTVYARTWKQPRCPSADEWIRKLWYIYTMECYSAIKKNTLESVLMRWMKLEPIIQSELSQKEKHQLCFTTMVSFFSFLFCIATA